MTTWLPTLAAAMARLTGLALTAPVLGSSLLPGRLRFMLAVVMAIAVTARTSEPLVLPAGAAAVAVLALELLVGVMVGLGGRLVVAGLELAGWHISQQLGFSLAESYDPTADESFDVSGRLLGLLAVVIFLGIGGHRTMIRAVIDSFGAVGPLAAMSAPVVNVLAAMLMASFALALKAAAPVLLALLLAGAALGLLQRTMPQVNILSVGLPIRAIIGLVVLAASLAVLTPLIGQATSEIFRHAELLTRGAGTL